jgi:hypothetical protein
LINYLSDDWPEILNFWLSDWSRVLANPLRARLFPADDKLQRKDFGKGILAACFVNDLGTAIGTAIVPTAIANAYFFPRHLLKRAVTATPSERDVFAEEDLQRDAVTRKRVRSTFPAK